MSRIENGPPIKDLDRLIYWAKLLSIPEDLLWFKLPTARHMPDDLPAKPDPDDFLVQSESASAATNGLPSITVLPMPINAELPESTRQIGPASTSPLQQSAIPIRSGGSVALPVVGLDDLMHIVAAFDNAWRYFDDTVVDYFRRQLLTCAADDGDHGPRKTLPVVLGVIGALESSARRVKPSVRRELLTVAAQGAEFAGWLYRDIGVVEVASYWRERAIEWAQEAGDVSCKGMFF